MDKISCVIDFVVSLNLTFGMYPVSQLKVLGRFKRGSLKIFSRKEGGGKAKWGGVA